MNDKLPDKKILWEDRYSVGVKQIDDQHKRMFQMINSLIVLIHDGADKESVEKVSSDLLAYKIEHFATEEKYFHEFNYEGTEAHEAAHRLFDQRITSFKEKYPDDPVSFAFDLVDFLEDWLIGHLMSTDQKYVKCFKEHGLS